MVQTSNFWKSRGDPRCVAISSSVPKDYEGRQYKKLAPPWAIVQKNKSGALSDAAFVSEYHRLVLDKLDAKQVVEEVGPDAVLLCWENLDKEGSWCHRRLCAEWLEKELGITVPETEAPNRVTGEQRYKKPEKGPKQAKLFEDDE